MSRPSKITKFTCSIVATVALYASSGLALPPETGHDRRGEANFEGLVEAPVSSIPAADRM